MTLQGQLAISFTIPAVALLQSTTEQRLVLAALMLLLVRLCATRQLCPDRGFTSIQVTIPTIPTVQLLMSSPPWIQLQ